MDQMTFHSNSLNPEFDEANAAILAQSKPQRELVCDTCGTKYIYNESHAGLCCTATLCANPIGELVIKENGKVIKLPSTIKEGKKTVHSPIAGGWQGGGGYGGTTYKSCSHIGKKVIHEFNSKKIFASNSSSLNEKSELWDLIIDLAGVAHIPKPQLFVGEHPSKFGVLKQLIVENDDFVYPEILRLHWTDMGIPPVGLEFWLRLWDLLPERTVLCCVGGHGRTGTGIASLMISSGMDYYTAVETVRTEHCEKAIECVGQELYLHRLYQDTLKGKLQQAMIDNNLDAAKGFKDEIAYAKSHVPTHESSYGLEVKKESKGKSKPPVDVVDEDINSDINTKHVGGIIYVQECVDPVCKMMSCKEAQHQGWVPWDESIEQMNIEYGGY